MRGIDNPEARILNMRINEGKTGSEESKKIRLDKLNIYQRYDKFEKMMNVYRRYQHTANFTNLLNVTSPEMVLDKLFRDEKINHIVKYDEFLRFIDAIENKQEESPEIDLSDVTSKRSRMAISEIMSETQEGRELVPADLDLIAVMKGYGLYKAIDEIGKGVNIEEVKRKFDLTDEMIEKGQARMEHFNQQETRELYDTINKNQVDESVYLVAGVVEIGPGEAQTDLEGLSIIPGKKKEVQIDETCLLIDREEPSKLKIDTIIMDPRLTKENKREALDDYMNKVEERNKLQEADEKKYRNEHDGKPSPKFLRQLQEAKAKEGTKKENISLEKDKGYEIA